MEATALRIFQENTHFSVKPTGLWLHNSGILGASPDGLISEENAVFEVKCPFSAREKSIDEACQSKDFFLQKDENGIFTLRDSHPYMDQVQGQMYMTGTLKCFFVVYTNKELCIVEIPKKQNWEENVDNLVQFYREFMLPYMTGLSSS